VSRGGPPAAPSRDLLADAGHDVALEWIDSHCHLRVDEAADVLRDARDAGVTGMVVVGTDAASSAAAIEVVAGEAGLVATVGVHPHDATEGVDGILGLLQAPGVVAVGECGLDYHYEHSPRDRQRQVFAAQIALARQHDLALVIHTREAWDETFEILDAEGVPERAVLHCFTGGPAEARAGLERGLYLSFSGIVSFPSADEVRAAAALCPADRLLVETDAPFLTPVPHRGRTNRPGMLPFVGAAVATARGESPAAVAAVSSANARRVFPSL
jgi:TatD DNase family protein